MNSPNKSQPPVPPKRKKPVGVSLSEYNKRVQNENESNTFKSSSAENNNNGRSSGYGNNNGDYNSPTSNKGAGSGINAVRQQNQSGAMATSQSMPYLNPSKVLANDQRRLSEENYTEIPESVIGIGVDIRGSMQFQRLLRVNGNFEGKLVSTGNIIVGNTGIDIYIYEYIYKHMRSGHNANYIQMLICKYIYVMSM
jgi:hypothetical protein